MVARCMLSRGSPGAGCMVRRLACATMSAASGAFGTIFPLSSTDKNDDSRFSMRFPLFPFSRLSTLGSDLWCRLALVYDVLLRSSRNTLLAMMVDSRLVLISLFSVEGASFVDVGHIGTPVRLHLLTLMI
jgi:hypothetical protein